MSTPKASSWTVPLSALVGVALLTTACGPVPSASTPAERLAPQPTNTAVDATSDSPQQPAETEPVAELTVWYFDKVSMQTVIPLFEQSHPGVKINFVAQPFGDMSKKYLAALAAKQGVPDVIGLDTSMVGQFLEAGEDLGAAPYAARELERDFVPWKFAAAQTPAGEMTAMPWDVATGVMLYRPEAFQAAGLPTEPQQVATALATWDDFIKAGQTMKEKTGGQVAIIGNEQDVFKAGYWQSGGNVVQNGSIVLARDGLQPLQTAIKAKEAGIGANVPAWSERWAPALQSGRIATVIMGAWMLGNLQNLIDPDGVGNWRITTPPGGAFSNGGTYIQIPKLARNKELAWEFTRFVTTNPEALNAVFLRTGIVPAYRPAWLSSAYDEPVPYLGGQRAWRLMVDLAQQVKPLTYSSVDALGNDLLNAQVDAAIGGKVSPQQALQTAASQLQERALRASDLKLEIAGSS
jgi:multiple sugar transport system substrate-binding protein